MTCIVGVKHEGEVYIGGDTAGTAGLDQTIRSDQKVFRNGPFVMGFTTSYRMGQILRYNLVPPKLPDTRLDRFMVVDFITAVRETLKDNGWLGREETSLRDEGGTFIVGVRDQLYIVESDFQVGISADHYAAVGCGDNIALGSLFTTTGQDPRDRVRMALKAAAHHSAGVSAPFTILKVK